jgi:protein-disulfide isomerase
MNKNKISSKYRLSVIAVFILFILGINSYSNKSFTNTVQTNIHQAKPDTIPNWRRLLNGGHRIGPADAPVQIVEFSDFQCPYCFEMEPVLKMIRHNYPQKVAITRYNFPLHHHKQALPAALAAECAALQGKYDEYHDLLFTNQDLFPSQPWDSLAKEAGVKDIPKFHGCVKDEKTLKTVNDDILLGDSLNVNMTPTLIINGIMHPGTIRENKLEQKINKILSKSSE